MIVNDKNNKVNNENKLNNKSNISNNNDIIRKYILDEDLKNQNNNNPCDKCLSHKNNNNNKNDNNNTTFLFSCSHNICLICMFNYFISNNFKGLDFEYITLNCPICKYGSAKFSLEVWINILNQILQKQNKNNIDINKNKYCNIHKNNEIIKYCNQCKIYLCELCLKEKHNNVYGHTIIDKNKTAFIPYDQLINNNNEYKEFEQNLRKKENIFYEKLENEYIIKKTKIDDLIRRLNQLLNDYTIQMNIFQKNIQNIFYIINISYFNYFSNLNKDKDKNKNKNQNITLSNKLIDIKFISQNNIDITSISNFFYKKIQEINNNENIPQKKFDYELIWSESEPKKKYVLKYNREDKEKADSIVKILELKKSEGLVSCQVNGALDVWDIFDKEIIFKFKGHKSAIWSLIETSEGLLISGSSDKTLKIWDIINREENCISTLKGHKGTIYCIAEIEKDKIISGSEDTTLKIWNINKDKMQCILTLNEPNKSKINCLISLKQTNFILTGNDDNIIKIWNISLISGNGYVNNILEGHSCTVWCLVNFSDDEFLASGSSDNTIKIWDLINLKYLYSLEGHENTISSIIVLKNGLLGSSSWDNTSKIWNLNTRSCIYNLIGHKDIVWNILELKNGNFATCSNDKTIIIWEKNKNEINQNKSQ